MSRNERGVVDPYARGFNRPGLVIDPPVDGQTPPYPLIADYSRDSSFRAVRIG
jgi:hypothetical protein